jgi:hypothetical protein
MKIIIIIIQSTNFHQVFHRQIQMMVDHNKYHKYHYHFDVHDHAIRLLVGQKSADIRSFEIFELKG